MVLDSFLSKFYSVGWVDPDGLNDYGKDYLKTKFEKLLENLPFQMSCNEILWIMPGDFSWWFTIHLRLYRPLMPLSSF